VGSESNARGINVASGCVAHVWQFAGFARKTVERTGGALFSMSGAFAAIFFFNVNSLIVIAASAASGIIIGLCTGRLGDKKKNVAVYETDDHVADQKSKTDEQHSEKSEGGVK